jgi:hypothetical protein
MPDTNVPTPMPGAKPSAPQANTGDPRAQFDKTRAGQKAADDSEDNSERNTLTKEEHEHLDVHLTALQKLLGKAQAPAGDTTGKLSTVDDEVNKAVSSVPGNNSDY